MSHNKKNVIGILLIIVAVVFIVMSIPVFQTGILDGGSTIHYSLIPWYWYIEYHQLPDRMPPHNIENVAEDEIDLSSYPSYVSGHGLILPGMEIVFDKYEVYPDGHKEKISGFNIEFG